MTEKPGQALTAALKAAETRKGRYDNAKANQGRYDNAKANQAAEKELVYNGELSLPELLEVQPRLKREMYEREAAR